MIAALRELCGYEKFPAISLIFLLFYYLSLYEDFTFKEYGPFQTYVECRADLNAYIEPTITNSECYLREAPENVDATVGP